VPQFPEISVSRWALYAGLGFVAFEDRQRSSERFNRKHGDPEYHLSDLGLLPAQSARRNSGMIVSARLREISEQAEGAGRNLNRIVPGAEERLCAPSSQCLLSSTLSGAKQTNSP
jgi:hypothetical protein